MTSIGIAIISWPGFEENAAEVLTQVSEKGDPVFVLHNGEVLGRGHHSNSNCWIQFSSDSYFAQKFKWATENIKADALLFIVADTWYGNWGNLVERCRKAFDSLPEVDVWAPVVDETWWNTEKIVINADLPSAVLQNVIAVDSIVWALSARVVAEMTKLDYSDSTFGWGIEVVCAAIARCNGGLVVRDTELEVAHRRGTTYSAELANEEGQRFYKQLPPAYQAMVSIIEELALLKTVSTPMTVSLRVRRGWGFVRDLTYSLVVKRLLSLRK